MLIVAGGAIVYLVFICVFDWIQKVKHSRDHRRVIAQDDDTFKGKREPAGYQMTFYPGLFDD